MDPPAIAPTGGLEVAEYNDAAVFEAIGLRVAVVNEVTWADDCVEVIITTLGRVVSTLVVTLRESVGSDEGSAVAEADAEVTTS